MRKLKLFTLILTLIFPVTCFGQLMESSCLNEENLNELTLIIEDGVTDDQETEDYMLARSDTDALLEPDQFYNYFCISEVIDVYIRCLLPPWNVRSCGNAVVNYYECVLWFFF